MTNVLKLMKSDTSPATVTAIYWSNCFLCEQVTDEKLTSPLDHVFDGAGNKT